MKSHFFTSLVALLMAVLPVVVIVQRQLFHRVLT